MFYICGRCNRLHPDSVASGAGITSGGGYSGIYPALPFQVPFVNRYLTFPNSSSSIWPAKNGSNVRVPPVLVRSYNLCDALVSVFV
jgi:hypothetical protein